MGVRFLPTKKLMCAIYLLGRSVTCCCGKDLTESSLQTYFYFRREAEEALVNLQSLQLLVIEQ